MGLGDAMNLVMGIEGVGLVTSGLGMIESAIEKTVQAMIELGQASVDAADSFEQLQSRIGFVYGSLKQDAAWQTIIGDADRYAMSIDDVASAFIKMRSLGLNAGELFGPLSDTARVTGGNIDSIALAFGRMHQIGTVSMRDIRALISQAIPAGTMLEQALGLTAQQMKNLGKNAVDSDTAIRILAKSLNDVYGGAGDEYAGTVSGKEERIWVAIKEDLADIGQYFLPLVKRGLDDILFVAQHLGEVLRDVGDVMAEMGAVFGSVGGPLGALASMFMGVPKSLIDALTNMSGMAIIDNARHQGAPGGSTGGMSGMDASMQDFVRGGAERARRAAGGVDAALGAASMGMRAPVVELRFRTDANTDLGRALQREMGRANQEGWDKALHDRSFIKSIAQIVSHAQAGGF